MREQAGGQVSSPCPLPVVKVQFIVILHCCILLVGGLDCELAEVVHLRKSIAQSNSSMSVSAHSCTAGITLLRMQMLEVSQLYALACIRLPTPVTVTGAQCLHNFVLCCFAMKPATESHNLCCSTPFPPAVCPGTSLLTHARTWPGFDHPVWQQQHPCVDKRWVLDGKYMFSCCCCALSQFSAAVIGPTAAGTKWNTQVPTRTAAAGHILSGLTSASASSTLNTRVGAPPRPLNDLGGALRTSLALMVHCRVMQQQHGCLMSQLQSHDRLSDIQLLHPCATLR